jgi:hypothetical protein
LGAEVEVDGVAGLEVGEEADVEERVGLEGEGGDALVFGA